MSGTNSPTASPDPSQLARRLLRSQESGVLSTVSCELPGYPFGSVTPFVLTHTAEPVVYVSTIAQHTKNMDACSKVSLTVLESGPDNAQALGRVTLVGDASRVPEGDHDAIAERYFRFFPAARSYSSTHDFAFYRIAPKRTRYIGGFGRIHWLEAEDLRLPSPAWAQQEKGVIEHMNEDHSQALLHIARGAGIEEPVEAEMVAVDPEGTHVRASGRIVYASFVEPAFDADAVRLQMIALARA